MEWKHSRADREHVIPSCVRDSVSLLSMNAAFACLKLFLDTVWTAARLMNVNRASERPTCIFDEIFAPISDFC